MPAGLGSASLLPHLPTEEDNCPLSVLLLGLRDRICICNRHRSPFLHPNLANMHLPRFFSSRLVSSFQDMVGEAPGEPLHLPDNVQWLCGGNQCHGSSGFAKETTERQLLASGWARLPTVQG
jgi:hypothetical protein